MTNLTKAQREVLASMVPGEHFVARGAKLRVCEALRNLGLVRHPWPSIYTVTQAGRDALK